MKPSIHHDYHTHQYLELIRLSERDGHFDDAYVRAITDNIRHEEGTPFDKLLRRARQLDTTGNYRTALQHSEHYLIWLGWLWSLGYFILGLIGAIGLLGSHLVNFFYLLLALLGWHGASLLWWMMRPKRPSLLSEFIVNKLKNIFTKKNKINRLAAHVYLDSLKPVRHWQLATMMHRAWIMGLLGNFLALLMLFLFRRYDFVWESTLLNETHIAKILLAVGYLPSFLGLGLPSSTELASGAVNPRQTAWLLMLSLLLYGILPRFLAYAYSRWQLYRYHFRVDTGLYYYEHLLRLFRQKIVDKDDYRPDISAKIKPAMLTQGKTIVATLELSAPEHWYRHNAGIDVLNVGVIDDASDLERLTHTVSVHHAQVYLGISVTLLPDRGVVRKLEKIHALARFGLMVALLDNNTNANPNYHATWQALLAERQISQVHNNASHLGA